MADMFQQMMEENARREREAEAARMRRFQDATIQMAENPDIIRQQVEAQTAAQKAQFELDRQKWDEYKRRGFDETGKPIQQDFKGITNADGTLQDQYKLSDWQNVNVNQDALQKLRQTGMRDAGALSPWAQQELQKQQLQQSMNLDDYARRNAQTLTRGQSMLAQSGGMSPAARERLARQSMLEQMRGQNQVRRQGQLDEAGLRSQDEQGRLSLLQQIQGMENQNANLAFQNAQQSRAGEQFNLGNQLNEVTQKRMWDSNNYNEAMRAWAADKSANAQASAARSGGGKK